MHPDVILILLALTLATVTSMLTGLFGRTSLLRRRLPWLPVSRRNVVLAADQETDTSTVVQWLSGACMGGQAR